MAAIDLFLILQEKIEAINQSLINDYDVRRKMLLKRLDVTVQSFVWSDKAKVHFNFLSFYSSQSYKIKIFFFYFITNH